MTALNIRIIINVMTVKEWLEQLRIDGLSYWQALDKLDEAAARAGYHGAAFYHILEGVYRDWQEPQLRRSHRFPRHRQHTQEEWEAKKIQYNNRCFYCGKPSNKLTKDHVLAVTQGGTDEIDNVVPACWSCNYKKRARDIAEFKNGAMLKLP